MTACIILVKKKHTKNNNIQSKSCYPFIYPLDDIQLNVSCHKFGGDDLLKLRKFCMEREKFVVHTCVCVCVAYSGSKNGGKRGITIFLVDISLCLLLL